MSRLLPCMILVPVFNTRQLKGGLRNAIAIAISLATLPYVQSSISADPISGLTVILIVLKEAALGLFLGTMLALPFWLFESVGSLLDNQRGALTGGQLNPGLGTESIIGGMLQQTIIMLLIVTGGIPALLEVIWTSYQLWPPTAWIPLPAVNGVEVWLEVIAQMFRHLVLYSAPLVGMLLFIDFLLAMVSLYSPQLQVFILAMPAKSIVGLALLVIYLPFLWDAAGGELNQYSELAKTLIYLLGSK
ncbi:EscT/YscT/HrcT family type III secretion system export apparatus protein [Motiliproteus sp. MSK22-1]|nr:EscT/YscT/HrcT family type III secretion system export apparatus protein [Motiliproteus sp. MSK22-1]